MQPNVTETAIKISLHRAEFLSLYSITGQQIDQTEQLKSHLISI